MKKEAKKIHAPWQHRFIAGLFGQLGLFSDRDTALYLQRESSFPEDGMAEAVFRSFAKGVGKFPRKWAEVLIDKCNQSFIERWTEKIFYFTLTSKKPAIEPTKQKTVTHPQPIPNNEKPQTKKIPPPIIVRPALTPIIISTDTEVDKKPLEINNQPKACSEPSKDIVTDPVIESPVQIVKEIPTTTQEQSNQEKETGWNPLPESIIKILTVSISESLDGSGKLNPRKLVRALNNRSSNYEVKRKEREIFFQGKRVTHRFTIPSDIELTA